MMTRSWLALACTCLMAGTGFADDRRPAGDQGLRLMTIDPIQTGGTPSGLDLRLTMMDQLGAASLPIRRPPAARDIANAPSLLLREGIGSVSADLMDAVSVAIEESDLVRSLSAEKRAAQAGVSRAGAAFLPTVSGNAWIGDDRDSSLSFSDAGMNAGISIALPLLDGGQRLYTKRSAESRALAAAAELRSVTESVALETINAAIDLNLATRQAKVLEDTLRDLGTLRKAVRGRVEAGHASEGDVAELEAELSDVARTLVVAGSSAAKSRAILSSQLRQTAPGGFKLPDLEAVPRRGLDALVDLTHSRNSGLEANWHRFDAAENGRKVAKGRYLPRLDLKTDYRTSRTTRTSRNADGWSVGLQLTVPLVDLTTTADVREADELANAAMHRALSEDRKAETQLRVDWIEVQSATRQAELSRRKIAALRTAYAAKVDQYHAGLIPIDDVLLTRRQLTMATSEELEAVVSRFAAITRLAAASGLLAEIVGAGGGRGVHERGTGNPGAGERPLSLPGVVVAR
ncbi:TolC family protein [Rhizobium sp. DKSPLA3]|uniref:TolC family protein n=1 Tax=Rhizobium quercicola TaxID=2901226 RepID=A0A9X1NLX4_9HYPH|nr:TolC family protein [Rhizobium quercicola]MCD7107492.1 TolC family protein [Rhizobium quercicola]